jgi:hypothetical protein
VRAPSSNVTQYVRTLARGRKSAVTFYDNAAGATLRAMHQVVIILSDAEHEWYATVGAKMGLSVEDWCGLVLRERARAAGGSADAGFDLHEAPTRPNQKR